MMTNRKIVVGVETDMIINQLGGGINLSSPFFILYIMDDFTEYDIKLRGFNNYMRYYG